MSDPIIQPDYVDQAGQHVSSPPATLAAAQALFARAQTQSFAPCLLVRAQSKFPLDFELICGDKYPLAILIPEGSKDRIALKVEGCKVHLPATIPPGYHEIEVRAESRALGTITLIVTPDRAFTPSVLKGTRRVWGLSVQLYALRSPRNWGIGDFTDLSEAAELAGAAGAALLGINPLHALFPDDPTRASPYSPNSRRFLNPIYLDCEAIPDFAECEHARHFRQSQGFLEKLARAQQSELIDYACVAELKFSVLEILFRHFSEQHLANESLRASEFRTFQAREGRFLRQFATFQALREFFKGQGVGVDWHRWPEPFRDPKSREVREFVSSSIRQVEYYEYLQWQSQSQFRRSALHAQNCGLSIGLYTDLAVSVAPDSAEVWANKDEFIDGWSIGAPPDALNLLGQNWGLAPFNPARMVSSGYVLFREMLAAAMRETGALRIDHVMGLMRLFLIPPGEEAQAGIYLKFPVDDLMGIVALESHRNRCLVVGEDLGTVPDGFDAILRRHNVLSYRLFYFEKGENGEFKPAPLWLDDALVSVATHDLVPLSGYVHGTDIERKSALGLFESADQEQAVRRERAHDLRSLEKALSADLSKQTEAEIVAGVYRYLAYTPSKIALVQIEDLALMREQMNLPGTVDTHPNWRRRLAVETFKLFETPMANDIFQSMREARSHGAGQEKSSKDGQLPGSPLSCYRLQFSGDFTFKDACAVVPYLASLGITHIYASPYLKARPGSTHGYDVTDHNSFNPDIGTPADFEALCQTLQDHGMGQILDFVPNHMGIGKADNSLWLDVLEWGQWSSYAEFFDIDWQPRQSELKGRVLLPLLGDHYGKILARGEFSLEFDSLQGTFSIWYHEHRFPLYPRDYTSFLETARDTAHLSLNASERGGLDLIIETFRAVPRTFPSVEAARATQATVDKAKLSLSDLSIRVPALAERLKEICGRVSETDGDLQAMQYLDRLLEQQNYRVAFWRVASDEVNFRRFFDVNELAAICMERENVFQHTHRLVGHLIATGKIHGLRLDHIDGLSDPAAYLQRLQEFCQSQARHSPGEPFFIVAEKILATHERLCPSWPISGTTGYDFMDVLGGLFVDPKGENPLTRLYERITRHKIDIEGLIYTCKGQILENNLASELNGLTYLLYRIAQRNWDTRDYSFEHLRRALREIIAHFPVYRTYVTRHGASEQDRGYIDWSLAAARRSYRGADLDIFEFIACALTGDLSDRAQGQADEDVVSFAMRVQQLTSPVMAKAVEDTAFYRYHRLISRNEVGSHLGQFAYSPRAFHRAMQERAKHSPYALNATATHDTKRGEDMRMRLHVLSQIPREWGERVQRWMSLNRFFRCKMAGETYPSANDEYFIYQTLLGSWPLEWMPGKADPIMCDDFRQRVRATVLKSLREAKEKTSWSNPDLDYEAACEEFVDRLLRMDHINPFLEDFIPFVQRAARIGALESLSQLTLKLTAPGVSDIYQGTEFFDFSMVDPDNRRPVDFMARMIFEEQAVSGAPWALLAERWQDGHIKAQLMSILLKLRVSHRDLFLKGVYKPVEIVGAQKEHAIAFLREHEHTQCLVVVGRLLAHMMAQDESLKLRTDCWQGTVLKGLEPRSWHDVMTGRNFHVDEDSLQLENLFNPVSVSVLLSQST